MQKVWTKRTGLKERRVFSSTFSNDFTVEFCEVKPMKSFKQNVEEVELLRNIKLITRRQSIEKLYPEWTKEQIDQYLEQLDEEQDEMMKKMIDLMPTSSSNGQFKEGNQAGSNQTVDSKPPENNN